MNKDEYIIINKTPIQRRIEILKDEMEEHSYNSEEYYIRNLEKTILEEILSQSTPLIPEIEKAFGLGAANNAIGEPSLSDYITNLKLNI